MKTFTTMLIGGVFLVGLAVTVPAEPGQRQRGTHLERLEARLKLSPEQVELLRPTFESVKERHQSQRAAFQAHLRSILTPEQLAKMEESKGERGRGGLRNLDLSQEQRLAIADLSRTTAVKRVMPTVDEAAARAAA